MSHEQVRVTIADLRSLKYCANGSKAFFGRHGLDWRKFVKEGIPVEELEATGDAMALEICEVVRGRR